MIGLQLAFTPSIETDVGLELREFLRRRVEEDIAHASRRALEPAPVSMAGLELLLDVRDGLIAGREPDTTIRRLLVLAHQEHPEYDPE